MKKSTYPTRLRMACLGLAGALVLAAPAAMAETVGNVSLVVVYGYETPPASARAPIYVRDEVVADTELETVRDGRMDVRFLDGTQLVVGPASTVKVDRFVYDPARGAGEVALNVGKGVMRFVTGRLASSSYTVRTPAATLGVRGTDFVVAIGEDGSTTVSVLEGGVDMTSGSGQTQSVDAGFTATTGGGDVSVAPTVGLPALSTVSFGVADNTGPGDSGGGDDASESENE